ncbi:MAG TPA: hypothetical protein VK826_06680 [Bacteroidia bacterium]|nr:hypothetical protein [Bacteroidia bacterium]
MENLPQGISILFIGTIFLTIFLFAKATPSRFITVAFLLAWTIVFIALGKLDVFSDTTVMPPRFIFMMGPAILVMILFFATKKGRSVIDRMDIKALTLVHVVRLPVEIVLFLLAVHKTIPELLTFEGRNFDIIMGITAYPMAWWIFTRGGSRKLLLAWNILGLVLLFNVVIHGVLSLPFPFQQFAFEQPNVAMLHSPYLLLPGLIVPVVMFSHFATIRLLLRK